MTVLYTHGHGVMAYSRLNLSPVSIQTQSLALRKRKPQETQAPVFSRKRQPIGMLGQSSGNHDWLLANASVCVSCGLRNASDCV